MGRQDIKIMNLNLDSKIEAVLFFKGEPVSLKVLSNTLEVEIDEIKSSLEILKTKLEDRGISLIINDEEATLATKPELSEIIEKISKDELNKELSKAALETLSIILYRGPIKRSEIDYIRGVNSQFILRTLSIRGLVNKKQDPNDERTYVYTASTELLQFLGLNDTKELPEYDSVDNEINAFINSHKEESKENSNDDEEE